MGMKKETKQTLEDLFKALTGCEASDENYEAVTKKIYEILSSEIFQARVAGVKDGREDILSWLKHMAANKESVFYKSGHSLVKTLEFIQKKR